MNIKPTITRDGEIFDYYNDSDKKKAKEEHYVVHDVILLVDSQTWVTGGGNLPEENKCKVIPVLNNIHYREQRGKYIVTEMIFPDPRTGQTIGIGELDNPSADIYYDTSSGYKYHVICLKTPLPHPARTGSPVFLIVGNDEGLISEKATEGYNKLLEGLSEEQRGLLNVN